MASQSKISFKLTGQWKRLGMLLDPNAFQGRLARHVERATQLNALLVQREIRKYIQTGRGGYAANAPLTTALKQSSKPLVDDADLFGAIATRKIDPYRAFVGILRQSRDRSGNRMVNLAVALHEGTSIPVTPAMRGLFYALHAVSTGQADSSTLTGRAKEIWERVGGKGVVVLPLKPSTVAIVIPSRPFIKKVVEQESIIHQCRDNWTRAVGYALGGRP